MSHIRLFVPSVLAASLLLLPSIVVAAEATPLGDDQTDVFGGDFVQDCGWPTTVSMEGQCTGTLVHPQVVIYAGHCGSGYGSVQFGEHISPEHTRTVPTQFCQISPEYGTASGRDWAFCVLAEPQNDIAIVPPLMGCEVDVLTDGYPVTIVGYGEAETGYGDKKEVTTGFGYIQSDEAFLGGGGEDACFGDSGGPVFVQMPDDGSWRVFGITSYGSQNCMEGGFYSLMHVGMDWFESASGFDLTPCFDADGTWAPTPDCQGFPNAPASAGGSWADGCNPGGLSGFESTCGAPFDASSDTDPPTVAFTSPPDGTTFDSDPATMQAVVVVTVEADDGAGFGVDTVELRINDMAVTGGVLDGPPYEYNLSLPSGTYALDAIATDLSGNVGNAEPIYIGVDMEPEIPVGDDSSGEAGASGDEEGGPALPGGTDSDSDTDTDGGPGAGGGDDGCGCRSTGSGPGGLLLGWLGLVLLRRRRR